MPCASALLDELLKDYKKPDDLLGQDGSLQQLTKALVERALDGELTHHLGYELHDTVGDNSGNSRNGACAKTLKGKRGQVRIEAPRDRNSEFEPQLVKKNQTRFDGFDEKIISLYARGMTRARDSRALGRDLWSGDFTLADFDCHRCRARRGASMASAPARCGLPDTLSGGLAGEGQEPGAGGE
jgi:hypothetical protein